MEFNVNLTQEDQEDSTEMEEAKICKRRIL